MAGRKTNATVASPSDYVAAIPDEPRRQDCQALLALMAKASEQPAVMWGPAIVGFGVFRYPLSGGKVGETCAVGFSSRKGDISVYGVTGTAGAQELLMTLGEYKLGKGCLYIKSLTTIDSIILEKLVSQAVKAKHS